MKLSKSFRAFLITALWVISVIGPLPLRAATDPEGLPQSWYILPEDNNGRGWSEEENRAGLSPKAEVAIERLMEVNAEAFDQMESDPRLARLNRDDKKWSLAACMLDLSLSASGNVGVLVAKGEATAQLYWRKKAFQSRTSEDALGSEGSDLSLTPADTREEIEARLEPLVQAIMATGDVKDAPALRKSLRDTVFDHHLIAQYLMFNPGSSWWLSRIRLDFSIDISGKVNPVTTVGGGLRIRLEWERNSYVAANDMRLIASPRSARIGENLKELVESLSREMNGLKWNDFATTGFELSQLRFGLGLFAEGKAGVVKIGGSLWGHVYFSPNPTYDGVTVVPAIEPKAIPVVDYTGNRKWEDYARKNVIPFEKFQGRDGSQTTAYSVIGEKLRKGLERAVQMGSKLATKAATKDRKWEIYQVKTEFALSISGGTALFKLGGAGSLELVFKKS